MKIQKVGNLAFVVGVILATALGLFGTYIQAYTEVMTYAVIVLGLIVGFYNIQKKETVNFLIATVALIAVGAAGLETLPLIGIYISGILSKISVFVVPAAVLIALKAVYDLSYKK